MYNTEWFLLQIAKLFFCCFSLSLDRWSNKLFEKRHWQWGERVKQNTFFIYHHSRQFADKKAKKTFIMTTPSRECTYRKAGRDCWLWSEVFSNKSWRERFFSRNFLVIPHKWTAQTGLNRFGNDQLELLPGNDQDSHSDVACVGNTFLSSVRHLQLHSLSRHRRSIKPQRRFKRDSRRFSPIN